MSSTVGGFAAASAGWRRGLCKLRLLLLIEFSHQSRLIVARQFLRLRRRASPFALSHSNQLLSQLTHSDCRTIQLGIGSPCNLKPESRPFLHAFLPRRRISSTPHPVRSRCLGGRRRIANPLRPTARNKLSHQRKRRGHNFREQIEQCRDYYFAILKVGIL